ncbi:hypothetical protein V6N13_083692 [Hibiscus sabdariffa]|uniref:Uncharacterized protein n=1 Tax=Hibiscus sabdariffa TaxID=183260 RepID=A0ABR2SYS4_9ROSI
MKSIFEWTWRDYKLVVRHVARHRSYLANRIAALGRTALRSGELLPNPPTTLTALVEEDKECNLVDPDMFEWSRAANIACFNLIDDLGG